MFQKIADEHDVEPVGGKDVEIVGRTLVELDVLSEHRRALGIHVDADAGAALHVVEELAEAAPDVEDRGVRRDPPLEHVADHDLPDLLLSLAVLLAEALVVERSQALAAACGSEGFHRSSLPFRGRAAARQVREDRR